MKTRYTILWVATVLWGCLDLNLLDDMVPIDGGADQPEATGTTDQSGNGTASSTAQDGNQAPSGEVPPADTSDNVPPQLEPLPCASAELSMQKLCIGLGAGSASIRFATDEAAVLTMGKPSDLGLTSLTPPWATEHFAGITGLDRENETVVELSVKDVNDNVTPLNFSLIGSGKTNVVLTEVLADPLGPEPAQEFAEIINMGTETVDLTGWMIDDNADADGDFIPDSTLLEPGQIAIIVTPDFDASSTDGPSPPIDVVTITLQSAIGSNGLKNAEAESVELYDESGRLMSSYSGELGPPKEGVSVVRRAAELPEGVPGIFTLEPGGTSTPGRVTRLE